MGACRKTHGQESAALSIILNQTHLTEVFKVILCYIDVTRATNKLQCCNGFEAANIVAQRSDTTVEIWQSPVTRP